MTEQTVYQKIKESKEKILNWIEDHKLELIVGGYVGLTFLYAYILGYSKGKKAGKDIGNLDLFNDLCDTVIECFNKETPKACYYKNDVRALIIDGFNKSVYCAPVALLDSVIFKK